MILDLELGPTVIVVDLLISNDPLSSPPETVQTADLTVPLCLTPTLRADSCSSAQVETLDIRPVVSTEGLSWSIESSSFPAKCQPKFVMRSASHGRRRLPSCF